MFDKKEKMVGAVEKLAMAERMRSAARSEEAASHGKGQTSSQAIPLTVLYVLAAGFALMITDDTSSAFSRLRPTGVSNIDQLLIGPSIPSLTGTPDTDRLLVILIRGGFLFLAASIVPLLGLITVRLGGKGRISPYVACWGAIIAILIVYQLGLGSIFKQIMNGF